MSRQLQRCRLSGSGSPLTRLPRSFQGQELLRLPSPGAWRRVRCLGAGWGALFCHRVDFVHILSPAKLRVLGAVPLPFGGLELAVVS